MFMYNRLSGSGAQQWCGRQYPAPYPPDRKRLKALERENRELKQAYEILRKASAFLAQAEHDRKPK
jgi:transposase-like protein